MTEPNECIPLADRVGTLEEAVGPNDPGFGSAFEASSEAPPAAATTTGPHRITMMVPFHDTTLSMGEHVALSNSFSGLDTGIGGATTEHIDFQTLNGGNRTTVSLGGPITTNVGWSADAVPSSVNGYGMATEDIAYHESKLQHYLVSTGGDVIVRAESDKTAVLDTNSGDAQVNAGETVCITGKNNVYFGAGGWAPTEPQRAADWAPLARDSSAGYVRAAATLMSGVASVAGAVVAANAGPAQVGVKNAPGMSATSPTEGKCIAAASALGPLSAAFGSGVHFHARGDVGLSAGQFMGVWGNASASIVAGLFCGIFGCTADVKGFLYGGMWAGQEASVVAMGWAAVKSTFGDVNAYAKTELDIGADIGCVDIDAKNNAQINADKQVAVYGRNKGAVLSSGFGMVADSTAIRMGSFGGTSNMGKASHKAGKPHLIVDSARITVKNGSHQVTVDDSLSVSFKAGDSDHVTVTKGGDLEMKTTKLATFKG